MRAHAPRPAAAEVPPGAAIYSHGPERAGGPGARAAFELMAETAGALRQRIDEAARFIDPDRLALSPQCGFASIAQGGNQLSAAEQFAKLRLVAGTARAARGPAS